MPGLTGLSALTGLSGLVGGGIAYYVDATGGNDANTGLSPTDAWQTIGKVNGETFSPGDSVLFKRGETWTGTTLTPPSSGAGGQPILFGAYGSGAIPIIDGNDAVNCISCVGLSYLRFENIEVTQGLDLGFQISTAAHHIDLIDCVAHDCGDDNVSLEDDVHDCIIQNLTSYDPYQRVGGPIITCLEIADGCYNITVDNAECYGSAQVGMSIHAHAAEEVPWDIVVTNSTFRNNSSNGVVIWNAGSNPASPSIQFSDCTLHTNTQANLYIYQSGGVAVPTYVTVEDTIMYSSPANIYSAILQGANQTFRRNVFHGLNRGIQINNCTDSTFYNNTFYVDQIAGLGTINISGTDNSGTALKNNIMSMALDNYCIIVGAGAQAGLDIDYNLYYHPSGVGAGRWLWIGNFYNWANWLANSGQDANSPTPADPTFTDVASEDFTLQAGSPAIDKGVDVGLSYCGTAPDCGAYEYCP